MKVTIELSKVEVASRGVVVEFDPAIIPETAREAFFAAAAAHGVKQAIGDAAASAKKLAEEPGETRSVEALAQDLMLKKIESWKTGEWGRAAAVPLSSEAKLMRSIALEWIRAEPRLRAAAKADKEKVLGAVMEKYEEKLRAEAAKRMAAKIEIDLDF